MTVGSLRHRADQVAELTRGVRLPVAAVPVAHLEIVAERLRHAFQAIRAGWPTTVASGSEPEVTALLVARLNRLIGEDALWGQLVLYVGRGVESVSFDGSHLEKRPDLSIILSGAEVRFPLVAEAKVLDVRTRKTVHRYCQDGLRRFVDGQYAWGNREAIMIGYVRDGSSIRQTLTEFLAKAMTSTPDRYAVEALPEAVSSSAADLARTKHARHFVYGGEIEVPRHPGSITVWHLWL